MAAEAQNLVQELGAEAVHHRHDDDERRDAEHDAQEREDGNDRDETFAAAGAQIAQREEPFEAGKGTRIAGGAVHQALKRPTISASGTLERSPVRRFFTSAMPSFSPRGPMITCQGNPIRSMVANLAPGRASVSS